MKKSFILFPFILVYFQTTAQTLIPYLKINSKIIYVDSATMKPAIEKEFDDAFVFAEGFAFVKLNGKYGYIDKKGNPLTDFKYEDCNSFKNGIARVYFDNKASFIDTSGKEIFPFKYDGLGEFIDGFAFAMQDEKWGYIDRTGKEIVPVKYDWILEFVEGMAKVEINGKYGFVNKTGTEVIPIKYDDALDFSMGLAAVGVNGKYGFIDKKGKEVIPLKYHFTRMTQSGSLQVTIDSGRGIFRSGIIDRTGKVIIPLKYSNIVEYTKGVYLVKLGNKIQLINSASKKLAEWDNYESWRNISEGIAFLQIKKGLPDGEKYVMINSEGKEISSVRFQSGGDFKNGIASVKSDDKYFFIDKTGKPLFSNKYDNLHSFDKTGITTVSLNDRWFYIDKAGREFFEKEKPLAAGWLFVDEFDDNRNGWGIDTINKDFQKKFSTGDYYLWNKTDDKVNFLLTKVPNWNEKNNFRIEITMHYLPGGKDNMGNGLIIGCDEKISNYYRLMITRDGQYRVDQSIIGKIVPLQDWKTSTDIMPYRDNKISFTHINGQWAFYINESKVYEMKAKEFFGKAIGMFIGSGSSYYCRSFKVYDWTLATGLSKYEKEPVVSKIFYDNFFDNRNQWLIKNDKDINITLNTKYTLQHKTEGFYYSWQSTELDYSRDFLIEMGLEHNEGTDDYGYGLVFGLKDMNSYYVFLIADGSYKINKWENGNQTKIKDWTDDPVIKKGNYVSNLLQVFRMGDQWKFYVNRHLVTTTRALPGFGKYIGVEVQDKQKISVNYIKAASLYFPE